MPDGVSSPRWVAVLTAAALGLVGLQVLYAVPALSWEALQRPPSAVIVGLAGAGVLLALTFRLRERIGTTARVVAARSARLPPGRWLIVLLALGLALRVAWVLAFPARPTSDGATYLRLAERLLAGDPYEAAGTRAYWPPGYPLFLAVWLAIPGLGRWAVLASNLTLFAGTLGVVTALTRRVAGEPAARLAGLLVTVWPNLVTMSGLPEKEQMLVFLLPLVLWAYAPGGRRPALLAGLGLGLATLVQPSIQLFVGVLAAYEVARRAPLREAVTRLIGVIIAMALVIAPWSLRNYQVFGEPVPLTTNGGSNLYRANNPLATGGYTERGERSLEGHDELAANRLGYRWAQEWIGENPAAFARLAVRKQVLLLGDDSVGVYQTLRRGLDVQGATYLVAKTLSNAFWLGLWGLLLAELFRQRWAGLCAPLAVAMATAFLYFWVLHSVFESTGKYHVPALAVLAALAATLGAGATNPAPPRDRG